METLAIIITSVLSFAGYVQGDLEYKYLVRTKQCDENHYIKTLVFTDGIDIKTTILIPCNTYPRFGKVK